MTQQMITKDITHAEPDSVLGDPPGPYRLGVIALANDQVIERDLRRMLPDEVLSFTTRIAFGGDCTLEQLAQMAPLLRDAAQLLNPEVALDAVLFGCTSGTIAIGPDRIRETIQAARPGVRVLNPVEAAARALKDLGARRINLVTPYEPEIAARMAAQFEAGGFTINRQYDFGLKASEDISRATPQAICTAASALGGEGADACFISCTDFQSLEVIEEIEAATSLPVLTSNQAMVWDLLNGLRLAAAPGRFGRMLHKLQKMTSQ